MDTTKSKQIIDLSARSIRTGFSRTLAFLILALALSPAAFSAEKINTLDKSGLWGYKDTGIAIRGYDTVAYFKQGKPVEGSPEHVVDWNGAAWQFANEEHANLFREDPEAYAPQYGGYCAYGVAQDYLVKIEPDQWTIVDGKLYLNYDQSVQDKWKEDISGFVTSANQKFESLLLKD